MSKRKALPKLKLVSFDEFINLKYKSFSHGNEYFHEEVNGLWYKKEDYERAINAYEEYRCKVFVQALMGGQDEKGNELAWS